MHKLKEMLMNELYEYEDKAKRMTNGKISQTELDKIHKLTDTVKNIDKIEMLEGGEYSEEIDFMGEGRMFGTSYEGDGSYARGRRNAKRDSMGRYSRDNEMPTDTHYRDGESYRGGAYMRNTARGYSREGAKDHLINKAEEMLEMADEKQKRAIHQFIRTLENE